MRFLAVLLLAGCAVNPQPFKGPNGRQAYFMECSGSGRTLHECFTKAADLCPSGYEVVNRSTGTVGVGSGMGAIAVPVESLAVECR